MKIALDARFLTHPQVGGFKTYTENLVGALSALDCENEYILYTDRPSTADLIPHNANFTCRVVNSSFPWVKMPLREQVKLRQVIHEDQPDLVHFLCNTAPVFFQGRYIVTLHDTIQIESTNALWKIFSTANSRHWMITAYSKWAIMNSFRAASKLITVSHFEKEKIVDLLDLPSDKVSVTHLAANALFRPAAAAAKTAWLKRLAAEINLPSSFILGIGYEPRKNIPLLINSFARVASSYPELHLVLVVAHEPTRQQLVSQTETLGISGRVLFLKKQPPETLLHLYNLATLFVYPSERESFGLPPLEAIACGTPTIALNRSSLPEILQDAAVMIDEKKIELLAGAICTLLNDPAERQKRIERGLARSAELTWQNCARKTIDVYRSLDPQKVPAKLSDWRNNVPNQPQNLSRSRRSAERKKSAAD